MNKKEMIIKIISEAGGIAKTAQFISAGLSKSDVASLCHDGYIQRVRHGYYQLSEKNDIREEQLIAALLPEGIVCMESALFHYGYSDFAPRKWAIAVPRGIAKAKPKINVIPMKIYYIQKGQYSLGKTTSDFDGVTLAIYDRERTICDCFKYRTKLDNELFGKAMNAYATDDHKNLANLAKYSKEMKLYKKVSELMEVLLG